MIKKVKLNVKADYLSDVLDFLSDLNDHAIVNAEKIEISYDKINGQYNLIIKEGDEE